MNADLKMNQTLLGDAKDANATCQPGEQEDLSQGMEAGGIRTAVGTENNQDKVLRPCEPTGAEDSQVECLMQVIGATTKSKDLY